MTGRPDPIAFELFKNALFSIADERALTIIASATSPSSRRGLRGGEPDRVAGRRADPRRRRPRPLPRRRRHAARLPLHRGGGRAPDPLRSPPCRTRPPCGPSSPTSAVRSPVRRLAPPHPPRPRSGRLAAGPDPRGSTPSFSTEEKTVAEVIAQWDKAYKNVDMTTLAALLTDDAVIESALGWKAGKTEYLEGTERILRSPPESVPAPVFMRLDSDGWRWPAGPSAAGTRGRDSLGRAGG